MVIAITSLSHAGSRRNAPVKKPKSGRGGAGGKNKKVVFTSKSLQYGCCFLFLKSTWRHKISIVVAADSDKTGISFAPDE